MPSRRVTPPSPSTTARYNVIYDPFPLLASTLSLRTSFGARRFESRYRLSRLLLLLSLRLSKSFDALSKPLQAFPPLRKRFVRTTLRTSITTSVRLRSLPPRTLTLSRRGTCDCTSCSQLHRRDRSEHTRASPAEPCTRRSLPPRTTPAGHSSSTRLPGCRLALLLPIPTGSAKSASPVRPSRSCCRRRARPTDRPLLEAAYTTGPRALRCLRYMGLTVSFSPVPTVVAADSLAKRDVFRLPDPFAVMTVDGEQTMTTSAIKVRRFYTTLPSAC